MGPLKTLEQLIRSMIGYAPVIKVTQVGGRQRVQIMRRNGKPSDVWSVGSYGFASAPVPGAQAVRVQSGGAGDNTILVAIDDPRYRPNDLEAGDACMHTLAGDRVWLKAQTRELVVVVDGTTFNVSAGEIKLEVGSSSITITAAGIVLKGASIAMVP